MRAAFALLLLAACSGATGNQADAGASPSGDGGPGGDAAYCDAVFADGGTCPRDRCSIGCGGGTGGCAAACLPRDCTDMAADLCPLDRCQKMTDCAGRAVCWYPFTAPPPACGGVSYYGQDVDCCPGLVRTCGLLVDAGVCDATRGGYGGLPSCQPCGNGTCDLSETHCNCPADCP